MTGSHPHNRVVYDTIRRAGHPITAEEIARYNGITLDQAKGACISLRWMGKVRRHPPQGNRKATWTVM